MIAPLAELPPLEVAPRAARVRGALAQLDGEHACSALLVSDLSNIRWLTGFTGSNGWVVLRPADVVLITDGRYGDQARAQLADHAVDAEVLIGRSVAELADLLATTVSGLDRLGIEAAHVSVADFQRWQGALAPQLVATTGVVEGQRRSKDAGEIARIERACAITDAALADCAALIVPGTTEAQLRNALDARARELGADGPSYDTIVATGAVGAARPHHRPTQAAIAAGDTVIIDVGALVDGYHSDMTRTFLVGQPSALQSEVYDVVLAAQLAGVAAVRSGVAARAVDAACREVIEAAGFGAWFTHGTGHGVGLEIHEDPYLGPRAEAELRAGDIVTVEPGVYRGDFGGVRVEDLVVVTTDGCRPLTRTSKDTPCLPSRPTT